jgi:hypothetical protein
MPKPKLTLAEKLEKKERLAEKREAQRLAKEKKEQEKAASVATDNSTSDICSNGTKAAGLATIESDS